MPPETVLIRKPYDPAVPERITFDPEEGLAKQSFKDETDINKIVARMSKGEIVDHVNRYQGDYADFIGAPDFQNAMLQIIAAQEMFDSLPAEIRARHGNDPAAFLAYVEDPENEKEMRELGLLPTDHTRIDTKKPGEPEPPGGQPGPAPGDSGPGQPPVEPTTSETPA